MVSPDLPDPDAVGYLLLLFDQCRLYRLTHEELVWVFGRPLLSFLDLTLQAVEKLAQRAAMGEGGETLQSIPGEDSAPQPSLHRPPLTPYHLTRLRDLAGEYVSALPDARAQEALLLIYDLLEIFELSPGQCETVFGPDALRYVTGVVYGERAVDKLPRPLGAAPDEATQYGLDAVTSECTPPQPSLRINGRPVPFFGTVGENGHITYTPEARLWLRYIGQGEGAQEKEIGA
jgi:hypothetical protein